MAWTPSRFLQQRRDRKAREREVAAAHKAAAWEKADERTGAARDWLLRYLDSETAGFLAEPENAPVFRAARLRVADMYPTDPLLERLVALDDKGVGARMCDHRPPAISRMADIGVLMRLDGGNLLSILVSDWESQWGLRPPGRTEHPAWGYWDDDGRPVPIPRDA